MAAANTLAARWQTIEAGFGGLSVTFHDGEDVSTEAIAAAIGQAAAQETKLNELDEARKGLLRKAAPLLEEFRALEQRHRAEVERPRGDLVQQLHVLAERTSAATELLNQGEVPVRPQQPALVDDPKWAAEVWAFARWAMKACLDEAQALDAQIVAAQEEIAAAYDKVDVADVEAPHVADPRERRGRGVGQTRSPDG